MKTKLLVVALAILVFAGCGGGGGSPDVYAATVKQCGYTNVVAVDGGGGHQTVAGHADSYIDLTADGGKQATAFWHDEKTGWIVVCDTTPSHPSPELQAMIDQLNQQKTQGQPGK